MQIPVLVEPLPDGRGFRARVGEPLDLSAEGPTKVAAIAELRDAARGKLSGGVEIVPLEVATGNPWIDRAGFLPNDEVTDQWLKALQENRRRANESPDGLLPTS